MNDIKNKRAVALYRVSTIRQTSKEDKDIPAQRQLVEEFIDRYNLTLVREFIEGGVSGFKKRTNERDALVQIKKMASLRQFDILVVYKSDRIGRTTDESPLVIQYLNQHNVRVFSVDGTELKSDTQIDKLLTWITFWQNETESVKISERSTDYQKILIENGRWQGGNSPPYGYKLAMTGKKNHKGRLIYELEIDQEESENVKIIYEKSVLNNMGVKKIAQYMNESGISYRNNSDWNYTTINRILNNPIYIGYLSVNSKDGLIKSSRIEKLIILSDQQWNENQAVIKKRRRKVGKQQRGSTNNKNALLGGLVYCNHCGNKTYVWQKTRKNKSGDTVEYYYRCYSSGGSYITPCDGQLCYSVKRVDRIVTKYVAEQLNKIMPENSLDSIVIKNKDTIKKLRNKIRSLNSKKSDLESNILDYKKEVIKSIRGESGFSSEILNQLIVSTDDKLKMLNKDIDEIQKEIDGILARQDEIKHQHKELIDWKNNFEFYSDSQKRAVMNQLVDKVYMGRDECVIELNTGMQDFLS